MNGRIKSPSPALLVAVIALFVAPAGTTYAAVTLPANSVGTKQLKNGAVTAKKISKSTISGLTPSAAPGSVLTYDATATASPTRTTVGTALGDTWAAECILSSGHANLEVFLKTSDGSLDWDFADEIDTHAVDVFHEVVPAGTFDTFQSLGLQDGGAAPSDFELQDEGAQLAPRSGYLVLHESVMDTATPSHTCHLSVEAIPQAVTASGDLRRPASAHTALRQLLDPR